MESLRWWERQDPYWDGLYDYNPNVAWSPIAQVRRVAEEKTAHVAKALLRRTPEEALEAIKDELAFLTHLRLMSAAHLFRTLSMEQFATIGGSRIAKRWTSYQVLPLYQAGLIDMGTVRHPAMMRWTADVDTGLVRPAKPNVWDRELAPWLPWTMWLSVTGGVPWTYGRGQGSDRHNVLTTELGLRMMEAGEIAMLLPEALCDVAGLAGLPPKTRSTGTADAAMIREDGARIAIEMTATHGDRGKMAMKINKWISALSENNDQARNLSVIFLCAAQDPTSAKPASLRRQVMKTIAACVGETYATDHVASRIGVANWREWFPGKGLLSQEFLDYSVSVYHPGQGWSRESWADGKSPWGPTAQESEMLQGAIKQCGTLAGIPLWFRDRKPAQPLAGLLMRGAQKTSFPTKSTTTTTVGVATGAVAAAQPPRALSNRL